MSSILRPWLNDLSIREQGSLLIALRGCDTAPKLPYDQPQRIVTSALRNLVLVPADEREVDSQPGCFAISHEMLVAHFGKRAERLKASAFDHLPLHYVTHLFQAVEIVGYRYPEKEIRWYYYEMYRNFAHGLHLMPEIEAAMIERLTEDRVANGCIVS